jgi:hypothetical protein
MPGASPYNASIITRDQMRSAIRVCLNGFTATVLQPGWYTLVRNGHKIGYGTPKTP